MRETSRRRTGSRLVLSSKLSPLVAALATRTLSVLPRPITCLCPSPSQNLRVTPFVVRPSLRARVPQPCAISTGPFWPFLAASGLWPVPNQRPSTSPRYPHFWYGTSFSELPNLTRDLPLLVSGFRLPPLQPPRASLGAPSRDALYESGR